MRGATNRCDAPSRCATDHMPCNGRDRGWLRGVPGAELPSTAQPASPPSLPGWRRCSSALPAQPIGSPPPTARQEHQVVVVLGLLKPQGRWQLRQTSGSCKAWRHSCRKLMAKWAAPSTHLAARRRHAHVVVHLLHPRRQVLHVPGVVLDLMDRDALGGVCTQTERGAAGMAIRGQCKASVGMPVRWCSACDCTAPATQRKQTRTQCNGRHPGQLPPANEPQVSAAGMQQGRSAHPPPGCAT